jgi:hypothetical protein
LTPVSEGDTVSHVSTPAGTARWFLLAYALWLFGAIAYFLPAATWNPVSRFDLTRAIVEHGTLSIDQYAESTGDRALYDGHWYTEKPPVPSLLAVPAYACFYAFERLHGRRADYAALWTSDVVARHVLVNDTFQRGLYICSLATAGLATVMTALLLFSLLRRRFTPRAALIGSACVVLSTPLFPYSTSFYGHAVAGAFLVASLALLLLEPGASPSRWSVRGAGACLVLAVGSEYVAIFPAALIGIGWLATLPRADVHKRMFDMALGALVPALVVGGYQLACFGAPWRTGYQFVQKREFVLGHASGLLGLHLPTFEGAFGLLVGERRGVLFVAPVLAIALAAAGWAALRSRDVANRLALAAFFTLFVVNAGYYMWWGGAAAGPRHLVPVLGFLAFGLAAAWERPLLRWLIVPLALVSLANAIALTAVGLEAPEQGNVLFDYAYPRIAQGQVATLSGASNLGVRAGLVRLGTLGPLLAWLLFGAYFLSARVVSWVAPHSSGGSPPGSAQLEFEMGASSPASSPAAPPLDVLPPVPVVPPVVAPVPPVALPPVPLPPVPALVPPVPDEEPPLLASGPPLPKSR